MGKEMNKELNKALNTIKDFCIKQESKTACLKCPMKYECSLFFSHEPCKWIWEDVRRATVKKEN